MADPGREALWFRMWLCAHHSRPFGPHFPAHFPEPARAPGTLGLLHVKPRVTFGVSSEVRSLLLPPYSEVLLTSSTHTELSFRNSCTPLYLNILFQNLFLHQKSGS